MNETGAELEAITNTIDLYIEGLHSGNTETLKKAFHPEAMMYGASPKSVTIVKIEGLYDFITANEPPSRTGEPHRCFVTAIRYDGFAATVEMIEESAYGSDYTNYFQLLKIDGQWLIVSKTFNALPKA